MARRKAHGVTKATSSIFNELGAYPGLKEGAGEVRGELYRITDSRRLFAVLDWYEGSEYRRVVKEAVTEDGKRIKTWVYLYLPPVREGRIIETGDYARFRGVRKI
ncbi:gamma-glutamylcyclotransferase family protein [Hydrogenimonas sp.]